MLAQPPSSLITRFTMGHDEDPIDYILAQVRENVKYLQSKGRVSESAARQIDDLLHEPANSGAPIAAQQRALSPPSALSVNVAPPPQQQQPQAQYVRALYDYNVCSLAVAFCEHSTLTGWNTAFWHVPLGVLPAF